MTKTRISSKLLRLIQESNSFLIVGHINPEADSLGSSLALALGLKKLGKKNICMLSRDPVPETLQFLPSSRIVRQKPPARAFDLIVLVDCNTPDRTGFQEFRAGKSVVIDHHVRAHDATAAAFYRSLSACVLDPHAAAAGVLVYNLLKDLEIPLDRSIATNLYAALLVDTGGFRYSNTNPEALSIASHLVAAGARPWDITREIYEAVPFRSMKLLGLSLATLERKDGIAWISTTRNMLNRTGTAAEDTEEFVDFPRKIKDVEVAVFFRQDSNDSFKISLRSKGKVDVQKIARDFGGGGHAPAAGCKVRGTLSGVQKKVLGAVKKAVHGK